MRSCWRCLKPAGCWENFINILKPFKLISHYWALTPILAGFSLNRKAETIQVDHPAGRKLDVPMKPWMISFWSLTIAFHWNTLCRYFASLARSLSLCDTSALLPWHSCIGYGFSLFSFPPTHSFVCSSHFPSLWPTQQLNALSWAATSYLC